MSERLDRSPRFSRGAAAPIDVLTPDQVRLSLELAAAPGGSITFTIYGPASTKGSTHSFKSNRTGKMVTLANAASLPAWTQAIAWSARQSGVTVIPKPRGVVVVVWVIVARPKSVSRALMTVKPDIDKVLRATLDALTGIAYEDDAQVVDAHPRKRYGARTETILQIWEEPS